MARPAPIKAHAPCPRRLAPALIALGIALAAAGCEASFPNMPDPIASRPPPPSSDQIALRAYAETLEPRYAQNPEDKVTAVHYAQALRGLGQHAQAVAVLQGLAIKNPRDMQVLAAYGKALADAGRLQEAASVLERAHTPDRPSWSVLSAQGSVADQMGDHAGAQRYYAAALKIRPDQPDILSNLGLSYALERRMPQAEASLKLAAAQPTADARIRQNLAMVLSLEGKDARGRGRFAQGSRAHRRGGERGATEADDRRLADLGAGEGRARRPAHGRQADRDRLERHAAIKPARSHRGDLDDRRRHDDGEQHRQEEDDHRHGELRRQRRGLLLGEHQPMGRGFPGRARANACPSGVPYFSAWVRTVTICLVDSMPVRLAKLS